MKKFISILLALALVATLTLTLISCEGDEDETGKIIVGGPEEDYDEDETVKKPTSTGETQDWGLGEVPLN